MTRFGIVIPSANTATEIVTQRLLQGNPAVHFARMRLSEGTKAAEKVMLTRYLPETLRDLRTARIHTVILACTSGTSFANADQESRFYSEGKRISGATEVLTASGLVRTQMRQSGWSRIALLTPYITELGNLVRDGLETDGFEVVLARHLGYDDAQRIGEIKEDTILDEVGSLSLKASGCDGIFVSCNNLALVRAATGYHCNGLPVLTSNGAVVQAIIDRR